MLWAAYAGVAVSLTSVPNNPIKSLDDLLAARSYEVAVVNVPSLRAFLKDSTAATERLLYTRSLLHEQWADNLTASDTVGILKSVKYALASPSIDMNLIRAAKLGPCDSCPTVQEIRLRSSRKNLGPFVKKGSGIGEAIDYSIMKTRETGNLQLLRKRNLNLAPKCDGGADGVTGGIYNEVEFGDIRLTFQALVAGAACAVVLLGIELAYSRQPPPCTKQRTSVCF